MLQLIIEDVTCLHPRFPILFKRSNRWTG